MCLSAPTRVSLSHRWRMVVTVYLLPSICTRPSKISVEWSSLLKRNSHQEKLKALAKSKHTAFQFLYHSVTKRKQTTLMISILYKALLVFTQNPVLLWLLRNWFLVRYSVCLFCSMTHWWLRIKPHYPVSPFVRMDFKLLLSFTLTTSPNLHGSFTIIASGCDIPAGPWGNLTLLIKTHPAYVKCNQDFPRPYQHSG